MNDKQNNQWEELSTELSALLEPAPGSRVRPVWRLVDKDGQSKYLSMIWAAVRAGYLPKRFLIWALVLSEPQRLRLLQHVKRGILTALPPELTPP